MVAMDFLSSSGGGGLAGSAIGAVGNFFAAKSAVKAQAEANKQNLALAREQMALQKEFAQNGVRWKVADAKAAGIHPLAALGANTASYTPAAAMVEPVNDSGLGQALSQMGQGISRAAEAKQLAEERFEAKARQEMQDVFNMVTQQKQLEHMDLQNEFLRTQIAGSQKALLAPSQLPPPMPMVNETEKGGPSSFTPGTSPFWDHFRNLEFIVPVPSGDLKDYVGENMLVNLASQLGYAGSAWTGKVRPADSAYTSKEREQLKTGMFSPFYYPFVGWRVERNLRHYVSKLLPHLSPTLAQLFSQWLNRK